MRRLTVCAVALLALTVTGCGGGSDLENAVSSPQPTGIAIDLQNSLLTLNDMPTAWIQVQPGPGSMGAPDQFAGCSAFTIKQDAPVVDIEFAGGAQGRVVSELATEYSTQQATTAVNAAKKALTSCKRFTSAGVTYELSPLSLPRFGDDSVAMRMTAVSKDSNLSGDIVEMRAGGYVALLANEGINPDRSLTLSAATEAAKNFAD